MSNIIQSQKQKYCWMGLMSTLSVVAAITCSGEYVFAQIRVPCIPSPTRLCTPPPNTVRKDPPHQPAKAMPPELLSAILQIYPEAITKLKKEDPFAVEKLRQGDAAKLQKLLEIAPSSRLLLNPYLQQLRLQPQQLQPQQLNQPVIAP
jgi:hypothetical protein